MTFVFVKIDNNTMMDDSFLLTLTDADGLSWTPISVKRAQQSRCEYYFGSFQPLNYLDYEYTLTLGIERVRSWQNEILRALIGDGIDANPKTIVSVDKSDSRDLFLNYEKGIDKTHIIRIGARASYERTKSLTPDDLDAPNSNNNSFSIATKVSLYLPDEPHEFGEKKISKHTFDRLNFHNSGDTDFFEVSWACSSYDDDETKWPHAVVDRRFGFTYTPIPPTLSCVVSPADFHCLDVEVYKYDATNHTLYKSESKSAGISIDRPYKTLGEKSCYFVIKNHDYASQGAFPYELMISYASASDAVTIDTKASGYKNYNETEIKQIILHKLYEVIDLGTPP